MTFKTAEQIHSHLVNLSYKERNITHEILLHLQLFQKISGHIKLGYPTMYAYMMGELKYSNDQAYRRLKAAKLLNTVPEVADKIREGSINLTQAMQLQNAIAEKQKHSLKTKAPDKNNQLEQKNIDLESSANKENLKNTISKLVTRIENKSSFDSQKIITEELQLQASFKDRVKPLSNNTVKMEIHLTEEQYEKLMKVKSQLSHQFPEQNNGVIIEHLCNLFLKEKNAIKTQKVTKVQNETNPPNEVKFTIKDTKNRGERKIETDRKHRSRHVPVSVRKYVMKRADNKCEFTSKKGRRCNSNFQLEVEHVVPFSGGGSHDLNNLKCFCSYHNSYAATQLAIGFETIR